MLVYICQHSLEFESKIIYFVNNARQASAEREVSKNFTWPIYIYSGNFTNINSNFIKTGR